MYINKNNRKRYIILLKLTKTGNDLHLNTLLLLHVAPSGLSKWSSDHPCNKIKTWLKFIQLFFGQILEQ